MVDSGMQCVCSEQGMAATCVLPSTTFDWTPLALFVALVYALWRKYVDDDDDDEDPPPSDMYN